MILRRFYTRDLRCTACNELIQSCDMVLLPKKGKGCFCYKCKGKKPDDAENEKSDEKYISYVNGRCVARLIIDEGIFLGLEKGIHRLYHYSGWPGNYFVYDRREYDNDEVKSFYNSSLRWDFVLEKGNGFSCLFFPKYKFLDVDDYYHWNNDIDTYVEHFYKWTDTDLSDVRLLINDYNYIVGVISKEGKLKESLVASRCFDKPLKEKFLGDSSRF